MHEFAVVHLRYIMGTTWYSSPPAFNSCYDWHKYSFYELGTLAENQHRIMINLSGYIRISLSFVVHHPHIPILPKQKNCLALLSELLLSPEQLTDSNSRTHFKRLQTFRYTFSCRRP